MTATAKESECTAVVVSKRTSITYVLSHKKYIVLYSVATTTNLKGLYLFYMVSEEDRRLTMSLVGHYYYVAISAIK